MVPAGQRRRRKGNQAHRDREHKRRRQVDEVHAEGVLAEKLRRRIRQGGNLPQTPQDNLGIHQRDDAHGRIAKGNRNSDSQNLTHQLPSAVGLIQGGSPIPMAQKIEDQVQQRQKRSGCDAQDGSSRRNIQPQSQLEEIPSQHQTQTQLAKGLQNLRDGGRGHVPLALGIAPHTGKQAHTKHRRGQGPDGPVTQRLVHEGRQPLRTKKHQQRTH